MKQTGSTRFYHGKRILVTGASGFLASNLVEALKGTGCFIRRLSRRYARLMPVSGAAFVEDMCGDITNASVWGEALEKIDVVFHFAAQTSVREANIDPAVDLAVNVLPMLHMLETCRRRDLHPVTLFAGTVTETGITTSLPVDETHRDDPVTVYDLHKLMAENYLKYYAGQGVVRGAVLRLANVYGPGPGSSGADRGVLNSMIRKALAGETLTIYGHGNYVRDYVYVGDVVDAFIDAGAGIDGLNGKHYLIGSGRRHTVAEAVRMVADHAGRKLGRVVRVVHVEPPGILSPIEERNFLAETESFSSSTGWAARTTLAEGIALTVDYFSREMKQAS